MLVSSLCTSHLLFRAAIWGPALPVLPTLRPPTAGSLASRIQRAFSRLLCWALTIPITTRLELLHILANQPPVGMLVAK